jgi:hypothetical protein
VVVFGDEELEGVDGVLESVFEYLSGPVVTAGLLLVDDVDEDF